MSAAVILSFFGLQAPLQALGAPAIRFATYQQLYLVGSAIAMATTILFVWAGRRRFSHDAAQAGGAERARGTDLASGGISRRVDHLGGHR